MSNNDTQQGSDYHSIQVDPSDNQTNGQQEAKPVTYLIPNQNTHFAFVIVRSFRILFAIIFTLVISGFGSIIALVEDGDVEASLAIGVFAGICLVIIALVLWWSYLSWKRFSWEVTTTELNIYSGVVFRKNEHISITRIHSIDHKQSLIQRALGVVELKVITASGSRQREAKIDGITLAEAENLSRVVFAQKHELEVAERSGAPATAKDMLASTKEALTDPNAWVQSNGAKASDAAASVAQVNESVRGVFGGAAEDRGAVDFEYRLKTKDLLLTGLSSNNVFYFLFIVPLVIIGFISELNLTDVVYEYISGLSFVIILVALAIGIVLGWIFSVSNALLSYGGFTVRRRGKRIEVERGILERHSVGIAIDRVQSVRVSRGLIRRVIGYAEITVDTVQGISTEGEVNKPAVVHPFIKAREVDAFIAQLLPEFEKHPEPTTPLPKRALRRLIFRSTFWIALFVLLPMIVVAYGVAANVTDLPAYAATALTTGSTVLAVVVLVICVFCGAMLFRARKWGTNESMIAIQKGLFSRDVIYISRRKVQWARISQTWFQKRLDLVTFRIMTAAGGPGVGTASVIKDIETAQGDKALEWAWPPLAE